MLRLPRSVTCRKYWKASEFRNFLLYYSVPCLRGILPTEYYNHLLFLVHGIYTLLKGSISIEELTTAHISVSTFHKQFQDLYGLRNMRYNLHLLNHIAQCVLDWGPLWANSAFGYEDGNRMRMKLFHGTQGVSVQITSYFSLLQQIPKFFTSVNSHEKTEEFDFFFGKTRVFVCYE